MKAEIFILSLIMLVFAPTAAFAQNYNEYFFDLKMKGYSIDNDGLSEAIIKKNQEAIELFRKAGIDFTQTDKEGYTPLERAKMTKDTETLAFVSNVIKHSDRSKILLSVNLKKQNMKNTTSGDLFSFTQANDVENVKKYAHKDKNLNEMSEEGLTPLHYAVFNDNKEIIQILIDAGADVNKKTSDGLTPLDIAVLNLQKDAAKIILNSKGGMSASLAEELEEFGCQSFYDKDHDVYDAPYEDIFNAMTLAKEKMEEENK